VGETVGVSPALVLQAGGTLCDLAEQLGQVRQAWLHGLDAADAALGYRELATRMSGLREVWGDELLLYQQVLEQGCGGVQASAAAYSTADLRGANRNLAV
jgi:hypothetical protein